MKKHGEGSARQLENGSWECMVQSKYINPDSKDMSPKRIKRRGRTENDARKKAKQALLVWEKNYEETRLNKEIARAQGMLNNEKFVSKAPEAKVQEEREKLETYKQMKAQVSERLEGLKAKQSK